MSKRVQCKFFAHGACVKGEQCKFSHDWKDPPYKVCTYYRKGTCSYGSRCRYAHVKSSQGQQSASSSLVVARHSLVSDSAPLAGGSVECAVSARVVSSSAEQGWSTGSVHKDLSDNSKILDPKNVKPEEQPFCSYSDAGDCPRGDRCPHVHGDLCPTCGKHCLHPFRPEEREEHRKACEKMQKQFEALKHSQEIECCVCLELVLSKPSQAERKFGLLTECDHPFCISCIRNWRNSSPTTGMDVNSTLRACPICRKLSYFVVPSITWYSTPEEKKEIIDNYKAKLRSIDCKHFKFGNGNCPFGTSCFYKHKVKPGSYAWKYNRPPPCRPRPPRPDHVDVTELLPMFGDVISAYEHDPFGFEDTDEDDDFTPTDMVMLLMHLDLESDECPSDNDNYLF